MQSCDVIWRVSASREENLCQWRKPNLTVKWVHNRAAKIKSLKNRRRKGIPKKSGTATVDAGHSAAAAAPEPSPTSVNEKDDISSSDSAKGNGDCQLAPPGSLKFLLQVLHTMSSPPTIPLYSGGTGAGRYPPPTPNGYGIAPFNGIAAEPHEPLDFRKVESQRRYVWAFHRAKMASTTTTTTNVNQLVKSV